LTDLDGESVGPGQLRTADCSRLVLIGAGAVGAELLG